MLSKLSRKTKWLLFGGIGILSIPLIYILFQFGVYIADNGGFPFLLEEFSVVAKWAYTFICFLQPIILPLPEIVTVVAGATALGYFEGFIFSWIGSVLGIITMFYLTKFLGETFIMKHINPKLLDKYHTLVKKGETFVLLILFIIPVLPDEIICVGAGLSGVSPKKFISIAILSKLITSSVLAYSVKLVEISGLSVTEILTIIGVIVISGYFLIKKVFLHDK